MLRGDIRMYYRIGINIRHRLLNCLGVYGALECVSRADTCRYGARDWSD